MASNIVASSLSDQDLAELLALTKGADSVELKLTVPLSDRSRAGAAFGVDPLDGEIRQVYFFDTPDLALNRSGVVVRARRVQQRGDDSVVKLRPVVPDELPAEVRVSPNFGVEVDAMPGGFVCSGSMKHMMGTMDVKDAVAGRLPVSKLFSKEQRSLYAAHAPEGLTLDDLAILGPVLVLKVKFAPEGYGRRLVAELWLYPDNSMLLELSTKCAPVRGVPNRRRDESLRDATRGRPLGRAGDENEEGTAVLLAATAIGGRARLGVTPEDTTRAEELRPRRRRRPASAFFGRSPITPPLYAAPMMLRPRRLCD